MTVATAYAGTYTDIDLLHAYGITCYGQSITVYLHGSSTKATLYTDHTAASTTANPFTAGAKSWSLFAAPGNYDLTHGTSGDRYVITVPNDPSEYGQTTIGTVVLWTGTGVPSNAAGSTGDFYLREDGGGAGATHVYFKNGASWIGVG